MKLSKNLVFNPFADFRYAGKKLPRKLKKRLKRQGWPVGPLRIRRLTSTIPPPQIWMPMPGESIQVQIRKDQHCPVCEMEMELGLHPSLRPAP